MPIELCNTLHPHKTFKPEKPDKIVREVLFALRLAGGGTAYSLGYLKTGEVGLVNSIEPFSQPIAFDTSQDTSFTEIDQERIEPFEKLFKSSDIENSWDKIAASRYMMCALRSDQSDVLMYATIGLESVLLPKDQFTELSCRFRLYGALLLSRTATEASTISEKLKEIYNTRSTLVHGSRDFEGQDSIYNISHNGIEYLRQVLSLIIMGHYDARSEWDKHLETLLFKGVKET